VKALGVVGIRAAVLVADHRVQLGQPGASTPRRGWHFGRCWVVTLVARLVPIKRVDRFVRVANLLRDVSDVTFMIVAGGEMLGRTVRRRDMPDVYFESDVVVQTSDNEGTPVALIEAQAACLPVVTTGVGRVASTVLDGKTGRITALGDDAAMADASRAISAIQ
jgi:glycosyltransferase involved in cell wall biosynthesis